MAMLTFIDCNINIEGPCKTEVKQVSKSGSKTNYSYVPLSPGEYMVHVKAKGKDIYGSPFSAKVSGTTTNRHEFNSFCRISSISQSQKCLFHEKVK